MNNEITNSLNFLKDNTKRFIQVFSDADIKKFKKSSKNTQWIYFFQWTEDKYNWGTMSNKNDRLRKSSIFNKKLTGKYDRRGDYLMLQEIYPNVKVFMFEVNEGEKATVKEGELRDSFNQKHCYRGFEGKDRLEISMSILKEFKKTEHYKNVSEEDKTNWEEFITKIFTQNVKYKKRSFAWGDSLEPRAGFFSKDK